MEYKSRGGEAVKSVMIICVSSFFFSCDSPQPSHPWENALIDCKCTSEQWETVKKEAEWCSKNTGIFNDVCLKTAMWRNCDKREVKP